MEDGARDELLTEAEVQRLLLACSHRAPTGVRNRALVALIYCSGLRIAQVLALRAADVDLEAKRVTVRTPHGVERVAHLFEAAVPYVETWLAARSGLGLDEAPLFCTLRAAALKDAYVRALLPRLAHKAGVAKRVHAQGLRHSFAVRLATMGASLEAIARQLGHADSATTRRALHARGVTPQASAGLEGVEAQVWTLGPAPGAVRVDVRVGTHAPLPALVTPDGLAPIVVRPLELEELETPAA